MKNERVKGMVSTALSVLWWCVVLALALVLVSVLSAKASGRVPSILGYSVLNIVSGSMEDEIPEGSYVLVKRVEPEDIKEGDVISFYSTDPNIYGMPNTHRVVEVRGDGSELEFVTKGDANPQEDAVRARADRVIGVYVITLRGLTAFSDTLRGGGMLFMLIGLEVGIGALVLYGIIRKNKAGDKKPKDDQNNG